MLVTLTNAAPSDAADIVRVLVSTKEASLPGIIDDHDRDEGFWLKRWRRYLSEGSTAQKALGDGFVILAYRGDVVVGFAAYHHTRRFDCQAEVESLYVVPAHQSQGVGTQLLAEIFRRLCDEGTHSLCVGYDPRNPYKRFYHKHGAVEINPHWAAWREIPAYLSAESKNA